MKSYTFCNNCLTDEHVHIQENEIQKTFYYNKFVYNKF